MLLTASAPPPTLRHPRSLTSATALPPAPVARQGAAGAIKQLSGEKWRTWRAICRDVRRSLRRPPPVTHGAAPLLLPLPNVADAPAPVTPRGIPAVTREAHRRRLWMSLSRCGGRREQQGPAVERATDRPSETGAQHGAGHDSEAPRLLPKGNDKRGGVKSPCPPRPPRPRPTAAAPDPATDPPTLPLEPAPPPRVAFLLGSPSPPPPLLPSSLCPWRMLHARATCRGNVRTPSTASSLTLPPEGYRTWFPEPIQTATRRLRTGTAHRGAARRAAVLVWTETASEMGERAGPLADLAGARRRNSPIATLPPHLLPLPTGVPAPLTPGGKKALKSAQ